jgi:hypothetical protein
MSRPERPFSGEMATPIQLPRMPLGIPEGSQEESEFLLKVRANVALARTMKIVEYAKEHGIDPKQLTGAGIALAAMLGIDAGVPGLQIKRAVGRPRTRAGVLDMVELIRRVGLADTDKDACAILAECEIPQRHLSRKNRVRTLRSQVSRLRQT